MSSDALRLGTSRVEDLRCPPVGEQPLGGLDRLVDGGPDDRVDELDGRRRDAQEVGASQGGRGERGEVPVVELGEDGRVAELGAVAEHRRGHREPPRLGRQSREPQRHRARDRLGPDLAHLRGVLGRRREALAVHRVENRAQEERVAAGGRVAGDHEGLFRLDRELRPRQLGDRCHAERGRPDHERSRVGDQLRQQVDLHALLGRAQAQHDEQRQPFEAPREIREPAQSRRIGPVEVVDHDRGRTAGGQVGGEPVEPVQHRERNIAGRGPGQLVVAEEPLREARGARHHLSRSSRLSDAR